jgi:hypothetical protein
MGTCWYCDRDETEADAPLVLVVHDGKPVLACDRCSGDPG